MPLKRIDHYSIRARTDELPRVRDFYVEVLGLIDGDRPAFDFPGNWLYADGAPVVHLIGESEHAPLDETAGSGSLDHISFGCSGLEAMRAHLRAQNVPFEERPVPGGVYWQMFLRDPAGIMVELTFAVRDAA